MTAIFKVVPSVFGLRYAQRPEHKGLYKTLGLESPRDGGAGEYIFEEGDVQADDGLDVIRHKSNSGNFLRVKSHADENSVTISAANVLLVTAQTAITAAQAAKTASEAARDAAIIGAGVYATEAAGRAAVADGVAFKVQGSGDVAAYEYRRTNSTTSVLIATYPASYAVDKKVIGELGKNIFNKNAADVALGYFPVSTTGNLQANASFNTTGFIPVTAGTAYVVSTKHYWVWYDANKTYISGTNDSVTSKTQTSPANAAYMRCSFAVANWDNAQVELGTAPSSFEQFRYFLPVAAIKKETITTEVLLNKAVTPSKTNFLAVGKNLFNKATITTGFYLTNAGVAVALANHRYSDFIPVTAGVQYYGSATGYVTAIRMYCFYDVNLAVIAGGSNVTSSTFTAPVGAAYVRVTLENTYENSFQLEVGAAATAYEVYAYRLKHELGIPIFATQDTSTVSSLWTGKTWATLGDSITNANVYQVKVASMFGLTYTNFGVSGSTLCGSVGSATAMCQDTRINAIATTFDLITVLAGTNDWAQSFPLGATNSTDPLTFNGALNTLLSKLSTRFATKRIVMMTTTYGEYSGGVGAGWANSTVNLVGLTSLDYADAVRAACKRWGVPCIDLSACGWNSANIATYVADGLHPNTTGYRRMSEVIIGGLKAITPLV